jgi:hypothetical protein
MGFLYGAAASAAVSAAVSAAAGKAADGMTKQQQTEVFNIHEIYRL